MRAVSVFAASVSFLFFITSQVFYFEDLTCIFIFDHFIHILFWGRNTYSNQFCFGVCCVCKFFVFYYVTRILFLMTSHVFLCLRTSHVFYLFFISSEICSSLMMSHMCLFLKPLNVITLGQRKSDKSNQMLTISNCLLVQSTNFHKPIDNVISDHIKQPPLYCSSPPLSSLKISWLHF